MLNLLSCLSTLAQRLTSRARSLALDSAAIARFLLIALKPYGAIGAAYRAATRRFFRASVKTLAPAAALRSWTDFKLYSRAAPLLFIMFAGVHFYQGRSYLALSLSSVSSQIAPSDPIKAAPAHGLGAPVIRAWPENEWENARSVAIAHHSKIMLAPQDLYERALDLSRERTLAARRQAENDGSSKIAQLSEADPKKRAAQAAFLSEQIKSPPQVILLRPITLAFATAIATGSGPADFKAAAAQALAASDQPRSIPLAVLENAMQSAMENEWNFFKEFTLRMMPMVLIAPLMFGVFLFFGHLALAAARFSSDFKDPEALSRIARAELDDELASAKAGSAKPARRL